MMTTALLYLVHTNKQRFIGGVLGLHQVENVAKKPKGVQF